MNRSTSPHFSHSFSNCSQYVFNRAPSPPRFSAGEKVAEGRMRGCFLSRRGCRKADIAVCQSAFGERTLFVEHSPPSSAFGTFSPRKSLGGEGTRSRRAEFRKV